MKSNIYTRTGDFGETSLVGGSRVPKDSARLEAYGTLDELNSWIGLIAASHPTILAGQDLNLQRIQNTLFDIGAILATEPDSKWLPEPLNEEDVERIENAIDALDALVPKHNQFILPGGCQLSGQIHIARTVARRAERRILTLIHDEPEDKKLLPVVRYVNRLSDYLFVLARAVNKIAGHPEIFWQKNC